MEIFNQLPLELQQDIFKIYLKNKKEKINKDILKLLKNRNPFNLNSLEQLRDNGGTKKMCFCGEILSVDTTNSKDTPCYSSTICMISKSKYDISYKYLHNFRLNKKIENEI